MEYGSDEHLDGLSRNALKTEVRWWHDRATEMEGECERLQAENVRLQDENARLRSCLSDDAENAKMIMGENVKLRELVRDMWRELAVACAEQVTSHETLRKVSDRMRELGIEVDDA